MVSIDWGGVIAWQTTMWHPELVERLVTMASAHPELTMRNMDAEQSRRWVPQPCTPHILQLHAFTVLEACKRGGVPSWSVCTGLHDFPCHMAPVVVPYLSSHSAL